MNRDAEDTMFAFPPGREVPDEDKEALAASTGTRAGATQESNP